MAWNGGIANFYLDKKKNKKYFRENVDCVANAYDARAFNLYGEIEETHCECWPRS